MIYVKFDIKKHREMIKIQNLFLTHNNIQLRNDQIAFLFNNKFSVTDIIDNWHIYCNKITDIKYESDKNEYESSSKSRDLYIDNDNSFYDNLKITYDFITTLSKEDILLYNTEELTRIITTYFTCLKRISISRYKNFKKVHDKLFFDIYLFQINGSNKIDRLRNYKFIKRKLETIAKQQNELKKIKTGQVGIKEEYTSDYSVKMQKQKELNAKKFLNKEFFNPSKNFKIKLSDIVKTDQDKVAELITISKGIENIASIEGYEWRFITITCPSEYHRITTIKNGKKILNTKYEDYSPSESNKYLQNAWSRIRSLLSKRSINYYGLYCTEPHKDSTPHRHILIYANKESFADQKILDQLSNFQQKTKNKKNEKDYNDFLNKFQLNYSNTIEACFLQHFNFSLKAIKIEYPKIVQNAEGKKVQATPTTYILKYIMKSLGVSKYDDQEVENADKVKTTSSIFKYRRYGFFGLKQVLTTYRIMLKIQKLPEDIQCKHFVNAFNFLKIKEVDQEGNEKIRTDFCNFYLNIINTDVEKLTEEYKNIYNEVSIRNIGLKEDDLIIFEKDKFYDLFELINDQSIVLI